jgi:hypothetical protein
LTRNAHQLGNVVAVVVRANGKLTINNVHVQHAETKPERQIHAACAFAVLASWCMLWL